MTRLLRLVPLLAAFAAQGCISSTLVLHVMPDGSGHAVVTTRVFESAVREFDGMFPGKPPEVPKMDELLPTPSEGELQLGFGARVRLASTKLDKVTDGGVRTTIVDFDDITQLRLQFPPAFMMGSFHSFDMAGAGDHALVTFATKPHDNGDRLLLVKMPDQRLSLDPDPTITSFITSFKTGSDDALSFKRAIKGSAVRFFVELERPLLRTNAPARKGNRATIVAFDLDRMVNAMDEPRVRRMMSAGSLQEVLWQLGDLPGALAPVDHEVFLEYEPLQAPPPVTPAPVAQVPPDTEIYLAPMTISNGAIEIGAAVDITNNPDYDNQPFFTPDGKGLLFTSVRGGPSTASGAGATQTDIYRYDIAANPSTGLRAGQIVQVTKTPESEYSPTVTPTGNLSVIRVELDAAKTQRLWQFTADGQDPRLVLENIKPVDYHVWADDWALALFVLGTSALPSTELRAGGAGQPPTLHLADTRTGTSVVLASDIGRSLQRIPGTAAISFVQRERSGDAVSLVIKELNPSTRQISVLTPAVDGSTEADTAWTPDGTLLMVKGGTLYGWRRGQSGWKEIMSLERLSLAGVTRLAVSPKGDYLALVGLPRQTR